MSSTIRHTGRILNPRNWGSRAAGADPAVVAGFNTAVGAQPVRRPLGRRIVSTVAFGFAGALTGPVSNPIRRFVRGYSDRIVLKGQTPLRAAFGAMPRTALNVAGEVATGGVKGTVLGAFHGGRRGLKGGVDQGPAGRPFFGHSVHQLLQGTKASYTPVYRV
jgi:hypothetical protein